MTIKTKYIVRVWTNEPTMWFHGTPINTDQYVFIQTLENEQEAERIGEDKAIEHYKRIKSEQTMKMYGRDSLGNPTIIESFRTWFTIETIQEVIE